LTSDDLLDLLVLVAERLQRQPSRLVDDLMAAPTSLELGPARSPARPGGVAIMRKIVRSVRAPWLRVAVAVLLGERDSSPRSCAGLSSAVRSSFSRGECVGGVAVLRITAL